MSFARLHALFFLLIFLVLGANVSGQANLNIQNGLPSNHVYQMLNDHYGYLWIATTNGVARYNGYNLKTYTTADGLPSNDVWSIHLDKKGRLWLLCFANALGYIHNNKYHKTHVVNDSNILSTERIGEHKDGIAFITKFRHPLGYSLFKEKNDTLTNLKNGYFVYIFYLDRNGNFYYNVWKSNRLYTFNLSDNNFKIKNQCVFDTSVHSLWSSFNYRIPYYDHEIMYGTEKNIVYNLNLTTGKHDTLTFPNGAITKVLHTDKYLYIMSGNVAYKFDSTMTCLDTAHVATLTDGQVSSAGNLNYLFEDQFWGKSVATQSNGLFILPNKKNLFRRFDSFSDFGYKYLGNINDSTGYWWNADRGTLAVVTGNGKIKFFCYDFHKTIKKIAPVDEEISLLFPSFYPILLNNKTGTFRNITINFLDPAGQIHLHASDALVKKDTMYAINSSVFLKFYFIGDTAYTQTIYSDRFTGITYDSLRDLVLAYNTGKVILYDQSGGTSLVPDIVLKNLSLNSIEQILTDKFGNIFLKDGDKLLSITPQKAAYRNLFQQCNLSDAKISRKGNMLMAAGKFGISFCIIYGADSFSQPVYYYNEKFASYQVVHDVQILRDNILLNTDKGFYTIDLPNEKDFQKKESHRPYNLIIAYGNDLFNAKNNDSFFINQDDTRIVFDIINPSGSGQVKYKYRIAGTDTSWQELANNELTLSNLQPGKYYTLLLNMRDDAWRSSPIRLHIYTIPFWWQTNPGRAILWLIGIILLAGLIASTIVITRKIIIQNNLKKNKLLELEIKSIHSQINPHFIFNTLNTTLHYIVKKRLDEAYDHVSSFSSLLRAYLKSSRNRYISLGEEINNLRNYIHLQQTRFENAFTYEIVTDIPQGTTINIPSFLLQPIVENAINHGLLPKNGPGHLKLSFIVERHTNKLTCIIEDDGIGRKHSISDKLRNTTQRESYGGQLIQELVDILNKYENAGIEIKYIDKQLPETGTTVIITIKNALKDGELHMPDRRRRKQSN